MEKVIKAISTAAHVVGKKESLPVLSCVVLEVEKDLFVNATNLETAVRVSTPAEKSKKGMVAVPAQVLLQTLQASREGKVVLDASDGNLSVKTTHGETTIKTIPHDEFPKLTPQKNTNQCALPQKTFIEGVHAVSYAASQSLIRPELSSIYITYTDGQVVFVATDSFRLSEKKFHVPIKKEIPDILIPAKNALEIIHILEHVDAEELTLGFDEAQLQIQVPTTTITSRIIDGTFPNYKEIIPKTFSTEATLLKTDFSTVTKKARTFTNTSQQIGFHIYPKKKVFTLTARNADVGEMSDTLEAAISGDDLDINFNLRYIADCLQSISSDSLVLKFAGAGKPLVVQGVSDASFTYLLMPLNR